MPIPWSHMQGPSQESQDARLCFQQGLSFQAGTCPSIFSLLYVGREPLCSVHLQGPAQALPPLVINTRQDIALLPASADLGGGCHFCLGRREEGTQRRAGTGLAFFACPCGHPACSPLCLPSLSSPLTFILFIKGPGGYFAKWVVTPASSRDLGQSLKPC